MSEPNDENENENEELQKLNLLQLETKEILSECHFPTNSDDTNKSNYKTLLNIQEYIETIKNIVEKLPSHKSLVSISTDYLKSDLYKKHKNKWEVQYDKKTMYDGMDVIGSYESDTMTSMFGNGNMIPTVDLVFYVNDVFWKEKDHLNHRYFDKRNLMMLHIGQYLVKKKFQSNVGNVDLSYFRNDARKLVLLISPPKKVKFQIRILLGTRKFPFNYSRLFPNCINIKESQKATSLYNHAIIEDCSFPSNQTFIEETISEEINNFEESLVLLKVWSSIHGLRNAHDGLSSYELTMVVMYCYRTKRISRGMTVLQVFTTVLHFIQDLFDPTEKKKYIMMPNAKSDQEVRYQKEYNDSLLQGFIKERKDIPILLNEERTMNIFARLSSSSCALIHHHVYHTCSAQQEWNVQSLFLQSKRFWNVFDVYLQIPYFKAKDNDIPLNRVDIGDEEYTRQSICYILKHALNDRITLIRPYTTGNGNNSEDIPTWSLNTHPIKPKQYIIGIQFSSNSDALTRMVDKCMENKDLFTFIYGDKVELRRFRDGTIHSSVVWQSSDRYLGVIREVISHVLQLHFKVDYALCNSQLVSLIEGPHDSISLTKNIIHVYNALSLLLMNHHSNSDDKMPLSIDSITTTSPVLRYSALFPTQPCHQLGYQEKSDYSYKTTQEQPINIQISFQQGSKAWPRDVHAIKATKCAMLITLANTIEYLRDEEFHADYQSFGGDINVFSDHIDFGYKGYSWRIYIQSNEELKVLRQLKVPTPNAIQLYKELYIVNVLQPIHHSTIHTLNTKHPSASGTIRLVQRWLSTHFISSNIFPLNILELLVSHVYLHYSKSLHSYPNTPILGFVRFLYFVSTFDFQYNPIMIQFNDEAFRHQEVLQTQKLFKAVRGDDYTLGPPCYIVTSMEYTLLQNDSTLQSNNSINYSDWLLSSIHTSHKPERIVWNRFVGLAKRCYDYIMHPLLHHKSSSSVLPLFQESSTSLQKYHVLLRINTDLFNDTSCSSTCLNKEKEHFSFENGMELRKKGPKIWRSRMKYKNLDKDETIVHGWNPIQEFVTYIQAKYNEYCLFFYNQYTPHVIGILFRPHVLAFDTPVAISVRNCDYKRPLNDDHMGVFNVEDIVREITCIGEEIVEDVKIMIDLPVVKKQRIESDGDSSSSSSSGDDSDDSDDE